MDGGWHYLRDGTTTGPMSLADLTAVLRVLPDWKFQLVWRPGMDQWVAAGGVPELAKGLMPPPTAAPVTQQLNVPDRVKTRSVSATKKIIFAVLLLGGAFLGWAFFVNDNPVTSAKVKCEFAVEKSTGYNVSVMDVARASVVGDVFNGTVDMPFTVAGQSHYGTCVFRDGQIWSVKVDGKLLAGRW